MAWIHVIHDVEDYNEWKSVFDEMEPRKQSYGWKQSMVFNATGSPNELLVMEEFESVDQARAFLNSDELRTTMERAGVRGEPDVQILEERARETSHVHT